MNGCLNYQQLLDVAIDEAKLAVLEGNAPIGAAIFDHTGKLIGKSHSRCGNNHGQTTMHGEFRAFLQAGEPCSGKIMVTTVAPCKHCSDLIRQYNIGTVVIGEAVSFVGGMYWLREVGVNVIDLNSPECFTMMAHYIYQHPYDWHNEVGEDMVEADRADMTAA